MLGMHFNPIRRHIVGCCIRIQMWARDNECVRVSIAIILWIPYRARRWPRTFQHDCLIWFIYLITKFVQSEVGLLPTTKSHCRPTHKSPYAYRQCHSTLILGGFNVSKCGFTPHFLIFLWMQHLSIESIFQHRPTLLMGKWCVYAHCSATRSSHLFAICLAHVNVNFVMRLFQSSTWTFQECSLFRYFRNAFAMVAEHYFRPLQLPAQLIHIKIFQISLGK